MNTVVLILSADRSGSTWLGYVLGGHSFCAFVGEYYRAWHDEIRQPCSWCLALGKESCDPLHGIEFVPPVSAYDFALQRLSATFVIDSSKKVEWAARFAAPNGRFDVKVVHLIRDPRGWYESQRRRCPAPLHEQLNQWQQENSTIRSFLENTGLPALTVFYDELAAQPEREFAELCAFIGFPFCVDALAYWKKPHHGFAANGASTPVFRHLPHADAMPMFISGDDEFYARFGKTSFVDDRWKTRLTADEKGAAQNHYGIGGLLGSYDRVLLAAGKMEARALPQRWTTGGKRFLEQEAD